MPTPRRSPAFRAPCGWRAATASLGQSRGCRLAARPAVPGRPSLLGRRPGSGTLEPRVSSEPAAVPVWVKGVLVLYGLLLCVAFGLVGNQSPSERTVYQTTQEVIHAIQTAGPPGFVGQVGFFATTAVPPGWIICDGRALDAAEYPDLATALGTGVNSTAFRVPDMVTGNLFPRGGLTPGVVQEQSVAVDDLGATVEVWDYANPSTVVPWWSSSPRTRDPDAAAADCQPVLVTGRTPGRRTLGCGRTRSRSTRLGRTRCGLQRLCSCPPSTGAARDAVGIYGSEARPTAS